MRLPPPSERRVSQIKALFRQLDVHKTEWLEAGVVQAFVEGLEHFQLEEQVDERLEELLRRNNVLGDGKVRVRVRARARRHCLEPGFLGRGRRGTDALEGEGVPPPPLQSAQPMPSHWLPDSKRRFVTDSNRPQPLWQPPATACLPASAATTELLSLLMHPLGGGGKECASSFLELMPPPAHRPAHHVRHTHPLPKRTRACPQPQVHGGLAHAPRTARPSVLVYKRGGGVLWL